MAIYLVAEDEDGQDPSQEILNAYAMEHGIGYPLLADIGWQVQTRFSRDQFMPSLTLLSPGPTVEIVDGDVTDADIEALLGL